MRGTLHKTESGWCVSHATYDAASERWTAGKLLLHPQDVKTCNDYGDYSIDWEGKQVEFLVHEVWEQADGETQVSRYAKLADAVHEDVVMNGPQYIPEISDEEIEKAANNPNNDGYSFIEGAKWYRQQLKNR